VELQKRVKGKGEANKPPQRSYSFQKPPLHSKGLVSTLQAEPPLRLLLKHLANPLLSLLMLGDVLGVKALVI